ncbi:hypothetical protein LP414_02790 [Polaromonas sp. P1(28)-13]|nr:hypothetical protein LP417_02770 [Polaromonas sp. P1-6]UUZ76607.1 hypothetical protein LP414_02790 [Polaromonas sp. P1(28)-13]
MVNTSEVVNECQQQWSVISGTIGNDYQRMHRTLWPAASSQTKWKFSMKRVIGGTIKSLAVITVLMCSGCAVVAVADATVTVAATVVKTGVKATGAVIDAVIPDSK